MTAAARPMPSAVGSSPDDRRTVLWLGGAPPPTLVSACADRALDFVSVANGAEGQLSNACGIVLEMGPGGDQVRADLARLALRHGLKVALAHATGISNDEYSRRAAALIELADADRVIAPFRDWAEIARRIDRHNPGRGLGLGLTLAGDIADDAESDLLIRRAFSDMSGLSLERVHVGKSGAGVWIATAEGVSALEWPQPFLVKAGPLAEIREEFTRFNVFVRPKRNFRHTPGMIPERYVEGCTSGLLVQEFVTNASPFKVAIAHAPPGPLVSSLFDTALDGFHRCGGQTIGSICDALEGIRALKWLKPELATAAESAVRMPGAPSLQQLRDQFRRIAPMPFTRSFIHADLHVDNLFAQALGTDVIVVDYRSASEGPLVADHACLEVSLTFPNFTAGEMNPALVALPEGWLAQTYLYPLPAAPARRYPGVPDSISVAVQAIRGSIVARETNPLVYPLAVAAFMLRFASFEDQALERRSFAYSVAANLVRAVAAAGQPAT